EPGRRRGLDRCYDCPNARMESAFVSRETFPSSSPDGNRRKGQAVRALRLRTKRLLPRWIPDLAVVPGRLSNHQKTGYHRRVSPVLRVLLGGPATGKAAGIRRADALSSG